MHVNISWLNVILNVIFLLKNNAFYLFIIIIIYYYLNKTKFGCGR